MRKFHSYENIDPDIHYYVPREELIERAYHSLLGVNPGHYITVWGPRQSGKSWVMRQVVRQFKKQNSEFDVEILSMLSARPDSSVESVLGQLTNN